MGKSTYKLISRKNPITKEYAFSASIVRYSNIGPEEVVKYAAQNSCIDEAMIKTVMTAWQQVMRMYFLNGHNVICHPLGSFISTIRSASAATEEDFTNENIRGMHLMFRPARTLRLAKSLKNNSLIRG